MNADTFPSWQWPDHNIGKRESRRLREEHNRATNAHAELLEASHLLLGVIGSLWTRDSKGPDSETLAAYLGESGDAYEKARLAIKRANQFLQCHQLLR